MTHTIKQLTHISYHSQRRSMASSGARFVTSYFPAEKGFHALYALRKAKALASRQIAGEPNLIETYVTGPVWPKQGHGGYTPFVREGFNGMNQQWLWAENPANMGFRFVGFSDEILKLNYAGWFTDNHQYNTLRGCVYQLRSRKGRLRFFEAYQEFEGKKNINSDSACMNLKPYCDAIHPAIRAVANLADRSAEFFAEEEREYRTAWSHGRAFAELQLEISETRQAALGILKNHKAALADLRAANVTCGAHWQAMTAQIKTRVVEARKAIGKMREKAKSLKSGDYVNEYLSGFCQSNRDAFNEGASHETRP